MNISLKWLREYVDFELTPQQVCEALTSTGLEVAALSEKPAIEGGLEGLWVGEVLTCEKHPDSDHLHVTTVNIGKKEAQQIVCGAPNVAAGQKVIVADIGCRLHFGDKEITIKKSKLRGVESLGMICAEDEIGIGSDHSGIIVLPSSAVAGTPAAEYYHLESDWLIEIDVTANRADALSHYGVARDLYAWLVQRGYKTALKRPSCDDFAVDNHDLAIDVEIANKEACMRYACVSLTGCDVKDSPKWLQDRLHTIGLRPINNIVDITNYIMMAYGQPMHCFDADMIEGHKIVVRTMPEGTPFTTLDGQEHKLGPHDLAICNAQEPMCIAGVFGGRGSGTYESTRNVVLESAWFHPTWIRKSARRHGLSTDASYRFERGIDPAITIYALKQAAIMCKQLAGGKVSMDIKDVYPEPVEDYFRVEITYDYINSLIGKAIPAETIKSIVTSLDMRIEAENDEGLTLLVPRYRVDVQRPCDVVEDILRIYGYNNVETPQQLKSSLVIKDDEDQKHKLENIIGEQLAGCGFNEIMCNSLTRSAYYEGGLSRHKEENLVKIMNPLSADLNVMRGTMLFGGLEAVARNINHKHADLRLFEFGNTYFYAPEKKNADNPMAAYKEETHLALWITGKRVSGSWAHPDEQSSFFELKAHVVNILRRIGTNFGSIVFADDNDNNLFSKSLSITSRQSGKLLVEMGIVSKKACKQVGIDSDVYYADINWTQAVKAVRKNKVSSHDVCNYPAVSRDLALLVDNNVEFAQIKHIAYQTEKRLLKSVQLFDVYEESKNLPAGKKSYAVNFIIQDTQKTLNDRQIDAIMSKLIDSFKRQLGADLR